MVDITLQDNSDVYMDEQTSISITVVTSYPDGTLRDITGATVVWVASFNGARQVKKDTAEMTIMLSPVPSTTVVSNTAGGQNVVQVQKVANFGNDGWGRPIADFVVGDILILNTGSATEYAVIQTIDPLTNTLTMVNNISNMYIPGNSVTRIVSSFVFQLLPGDTILPATKSYGTYTIWDHMAMLSWAAGLSPGNVYQQATSVLAIRGRIFIMPILDIS